MVYSGSRVTAPSALGKSFLYEFFCKSSVPNLGSAAGLRENGRQVRLNPCRARRRRFKQYFRVEAPEDIRIQKMRMRPDELRETCQIRRAPMCRSDQPHPRAGLRVMKFL